MGPYPSRRPSHSGFMGGASLRGVRQQRTAIQKTHALLQALRPPPMPISEPGKVLRISLRHRTLEA